MHRWRKTIHLYNKFINDLILPNIGPLIVYARQLDIDPQPIDCAYNPGSKYFSFKWIPNTVTIDRQETNDATHITAHIYESTSGSTEKKNSITLLVSSDNMNNYEH